jgi:hypothetical protein
MIKYADQMINAALAQPDQLGAIAEFKRWRGLCTTAILDAEKTRPGKSTQIDKWNTMFEKILWGLGNIPFYDPITKARKPNITNNIKALLDTIKDDINKLPVIQPTITKEERTKQREDREVWKTNNPIEQYKQGLLDYAKKRPVAIREQIIEKRKELDKFPTSERNK